MVMSYEHTICFSHSNPSHATVALYAMIIDEIMSFWHPKSGCQKESASWGKCLRKAQLRIRKAPCYSENTYCTVACPTFWLWDHEYITHRIKFPIFFDITTLFCFFFSFCTRFIQFSKKKKKLYVSLSSINHI